MKKYYVYRNLHTKTFSLKYGGRVIDHPTEIIMENAEFKVSQKGRLRVIATKRKNVHATVSSGTILSIPRSSLVIVNEIYYNPYKTVEFMIGRNAVHKLPLVLLENNRIFEVQYARN